MKTVLIVDDDTKQAYAIQDALKSDFNIKLSHDAIKALEFFKNDEIDAMVVDIHMPIINGLELIAKLHELRPEKRLPLFILSSDTSEKTKIKALSLGVKDFLWPGMNKEEITLRIKNHILSNGSYLKTYQDLTVDVQNILAFSKQQKLDLTLIEFKLLSYLLSYPGKVIDRDTLKNYVWPEVIVLDKTLNTHLTNLRLKLKSSETEIKSVKGEGIILI